MAGPNGDAERAARVARAWTLHAVRRWSLREIATELGVSHETVRGYIREAREAAEWSEVTERAGKRARMSEFLNELARRGIARLEAVDDDGQPVERYQDVVPALMKVVQEINRVEGNYAPLRVAVDEDRRPPDPELLRAMQEEAARAEALDADEVRRELEA